MAMINSGVRWLATALSVLALTACGKKEEKAEAPPLPPPKVEAVMTVEVVKESERSRNFVAVQPHLELGGTLYGYMDIEGDVLKLAANLQEAAKEIAVVQPGVAPLAKQDFAELVRILGLSDLKAIGASSVPDGMGYFRNRAFLHTGTERRGLMAGLGGKPGPFLHVNLAPADTAYYSENEMDLAAVYRTVREIIAKVGGESADSSVETALKRASESAAFSLVELFNGLKGRTVVVLRVDETKTWRLPSAQRLTIPAVSFLIRMDSIAPFVEQSLAKAGNFSRNDDGNLHI